MFLVTNPVTTVRSSGTIVSATVSLGYDAPRSAVEARLLEAAHRAELSDGFVHILELGDFAVTYRIAGMLNEVKQLVSARSRLRAAMLDALHEARIEIVSPSFMNTRALSRTEPVIPRASRPSEGSTASSAPSPEDLVFDKAEEAESLEAIQVQHSELIARIEAAKAAAADAPEGRAREAAERELESLNRERERLEAVIVARKARSDD
jgi:hypothetical protein